MRCKQCQRGHLRSCGGTAHEIHAGRRRNLVLALGVHTQVAPKDVASGDLPGVLGWLRQQSVACAAAVALSSCNGRPLCGLVLR